MPDPETSKKGGIYIPEHVWKIIQTLLVAFMMGAYGLAWRHESAVTTLKLQAAQLQGDLDDAEEYIKGHRVEHDKIGRSLTTLETELPGIKSGIEELKVMVRELQ